MQLRVGRPTTESATNVLSASDIAAHHHSEAEKGSFSSFGNSLDFLRQLPQTSLIGGIELLPVGVVGAMTLYMTRLRSLISVSTSVQ